MEHWAWTGLETHLDRTDADVVLVSSEDFDAARDKVALIARLRRRADRLTFIACARDPVAHDVSATDQAVRAGTISPGS